jgi:tyrosinase
MFNQFLDKVFILIILLNFELAFTYYDPKEKIHVRKNAKDMTFEEWESFKRGMSVMRSRGEFQRNGYLYQANIHGWDKFDGTFEAIETARKYGWHSCQHQQYFFLPWHRQYLYFFEKVLRQAANDPNLTVPYWDYFDPDQRVLPEPFRVPADPKLNPLYIEERCATINKGKPLPFAIVNHGPAFSSTYFTDYRHPQIPCNSFGGTENDDQGMLEQLPHNQIHLFVGGPKGFLADNCMSSRDPIFWLHHSQIDRIWESWLNGGGRNNDQTQWLNQSYLWYDEIGTKNYYKVSDFLDTKMQLNYKFDKLIETGGIKNPRADVPHIFRTAQEKAEEKLIVTKSQRSIIIPLQNDTKKLFKDLSTDVNDSIKVKIILHVTISYIMKANVFDMYLNLPISSGPFESAPYYIRPVLVLRPDCLIRTITPRDEKPLNVRLCYDVTNNLRQIVKQELNFNGKISDSLNITFVPNELCGSTTLDTAAEDWIRFKSIEFSHYFP